MSKVAALVLAAGGSRRFADPHYKKPFVPLLNRAVWLHSVDRFLSRDEVAQVIVVIAKEDHEEFMRKFGAELAFMDVELCLGGAERGDSVRAGLAKVREEIDLVAIHDAARPCVSDQEIDRVVEAASDSGAAILASPVTSTLKRTEPDGDRTVIAETVPRDSVWMAQTPQVFSRKLIRQAHEGASGDETDDAQLVEKLGQRVQVVEGSVLNIKLTTKSDLKLAETILKARPRPKPDGVAHPFADDDLWR